MLYPIKQKQGQVTLFIIIAIVIIIIALLFFLVLKPRIDSSVEEQVTNPTLFLEGCLLNELRDTINLVSQQGGSVDPQNFILYNDSEVEYLCYTQEDYRTCVVQQPLLQSHLEQEITTSITPSAQSCLDALETDFEEQGYTVTLAKGPVTTDVRLNTVTTILHSNLTLTKEGTQTFSDLEVSVNKNLYELLSISSNIVKWETTYGDADVALYMDAQRDIRVEKKRLSDGSKVYIISHRETGDSFQFAIRSLVWAPRY